MARPLPRYYPVKRSDLYKDKELWTKTSGCLIKDFRHDEGGGFPIKDFRHNRRGSSPAPVRSDNKIGKSRVVETPSRRQAGL
jgi:hypothetical protein